MTDSRVQYSSETAVTMVENRFDLVLIAAVRVRELKSGQKPKLIGKDGPTTTALKEIEAGFVGRDYLKKIRTDGPSSRR
jgi:DNA-directed RNA polymerase omega subunit